MTQILSRPVVQSFGLHLSILALALIIQFLFSNAETIVNKKVDFEVIQSPKLAPAQLTLQQPPQAAPPKPQAPPQEQVFGVSRKAITATDSSEGIAVKAGNTVAKEQDDLKLKDDDQDSLPIPADEFLVSSMPVLLNSVKIPYPTEARKAQVEGPVIMDVLIDQEGKVRKVDLVSGPGFGLNEAAIEAMKTFQFRPAMVGDQKVAVKIRYTYRFKLESF